MSATETKLMTADELLVMSHYENGSDFCSELIRGELIKMSPTKRVHGVLCIRIASALFQFVEENDLGEVHGAETGCIVERNPDTVLGVDAAFVSHERLADIESVDGFLPFAPDLAVEVLSPSNTVKGIEEKTAMYFAAGSRLVWIVNPKQRTVKVYQSPTDVRILTEADTLDGGDVLPGFTYNLAKLFIIGKR